MPVPLSPVISTEASDSATRSSTSQSAWMAGLPVRISPTLGRFDPISRNRFTSPRSRRLRTARSRAPTNSSMSGGLVKKSQAPTRIAVVAAWRVPKAVSSITGRSGWLATMRSHSSKPFMAAMLTSVTTRSTGVASRAASASSDDVFHVARKPCCDRRDASSRQRSWSSSTRRMCVLMARVPGGPGRLDGRGRRGGE